MTNLNSCKLKEFAGHNLKFEENGVKFFEKFRKQCTGKFSFSHSVFFLQTYIADTLIKRACLGKE